MKVKSKINYEKHRVFHDEVSRIIGEHLPPTIVVERVKEYVTAAGISKEEAITMLILSSALAVNFSLMLIYTDLSQLPITTHFHPHDAMISQLSCIMWNYTFKKMGFSKEASAHGDAQFIEYVDKHFAQVTQTVSKWIGVWMMINTCAMVSVADMDTIVQIVFKEMDCSIDLLILSYYYFLHDLIGIKNVVIGLSTMSQSLDEHTSEIIDDVKKQKEFNFKGEKLSLEHIDHEGKIIKFPNRTKH